MEKVLAVPVLRSPYAIVDALNREWASLVDSHAGAVPAWGGKVDLADLESVLAAARSGHDAVLRDLLSAVQAGNLLAGRTVLQALLGRLVRMARRDRTASVDEYVSALWCVLARYPLSSRPTRIAANLALDTLKAVHRDRQWMGRRPVAIWLAGEDLEQVLDQLPGRDSGDPAVLPEHSATDLIGAGRRLRLIDEPTSRLLHAVYVDGQSGVEAAARHGTTPGSLRVRCSRAVRRLSDHAGALAEAA
ncbi:MAG: hypothetical protein AVDCRST_MAG61-2733 [uncultured Friedmanniella sp.]|uniref:Uncharacterized protein n=1 Tax=uncultured Friedmanniella sp. TaxID=335381 RepID=A0A6J4LBK1_9ACTN|nr:hypothetical protein [uncultured Friedmanniella sp.]CAA9328067.1 MAG: hypothetical protein AVDCRST_MAG61-2733 [uncultured Friedmanniella sp.]